MKTSICVTVFNEGRSVRKLMDAFLSQSTKPNEIIVIDSESTDKTGEILKYFQKKDKRIRVLTEKTTRAEARNLSVEVARNDIILMTDAGCVPDKDWVKNIIEPFEKEVVDMVAGFYTMKAETKMQRAATVFLGVRHEDYNSHFLPSTRSVAFRKELWSRLGGFPENLKDTAEDTAFNYKALRSGAKIARVKDATVEWGMPDSLEDVINKFYKYARGDAQTKLFWDSNKKLSSHNIKVFIVFLRYVAAFLLVFFAINSSFLWYLVGLLFLTYVLWAFRKVYLYEGDLKVGFWGVILQFSADFAVMYGFLRGIMGR